jgi:PAS domain S-box-containing protein
MTQPRTDQSRPAEVLRAAPDAAAQLAAIISSSDDAIVSKDLNGIITSWNPAAERLFGFTAEEAIGRSIRMIIPASRQAEEDDVLRRIVRGESVRHFETVRTRKDKVGIWVSLTVSPIYDAAGAITGASKIARDISHRRREAERAAFLADMGPLLAASLDYEVTLDNLARLTTSPLPGSEAPFADYSLIDILSDDGSFRRVATAHQDPAKQGLLEASRSYAPDRNRSIIARPLTTGQPVLLRAVTEADRARMSAGPEHSRLMAALNAHSLLTVPLTARGVTFGVFTFARAERTDAFDDEDVTFAMDLAQRAALAVDNARMYTASHEALQSREQVLAVVSHDFRNAIAAIATSTRLLLEDFDNAPQRTRRLRTIARVCDRMTRLVQDLLDVARLHAGHVLSIEASEQDPASLLHEICESSRPLMEERLITFRCQVSGRLPRVHFDHDRILQVLSNLISNAVKFTPESGTIVVTLAAADGHVQFSVSDSGPGIRDQDLAHIFERFWQATRTASLGTGLGLPIAKGIVEAHGGAIWVESEPGVGTTFHFTLPETTAPSRWPA